MTRIREDVFKPREFDHLLSETAPPLPLFRETLKSGRASLRRAFLDNRSAAHQIVAAHAWLVDQLLVRAWKLHLPKLNAGRNVALVAVGGYGRGELHPYSDIDVMLLLEKGDPGDTGEFAEAFVRFLWDMGLEIGHSVRTLKDCVRQAKEDITVATNLMETRLLHGEPELFERMRHLTRASRIWPSKKFFAGKLQEQITRHRNFDDTAYNLEPNIKEGPGGLRDIQMINWVTQRHFGTTSLHDLVERNFLSESEYRSLIAGRNFIWRVRCGLHYAAGRREDRLLFDHQRTLAIQFGYQDRHGILAVEQFMKRYYRAVKKLSLLNEILLQHFQEAILTRGRVRMKPINRRFQAHDGYVDVAHRRVFERAPYAIMELFLLLQQHSNLKGVRANTIRLLRENLHLIDKNFRADIACRSLFMEIARQPRSVSRELRRMNAYGVLGAYIPAFGHIVGQMQHDLFHVYTVDQHSLFVLRNIRRFSNSKYQQDFPLASELARHIVKPERLYLAALFHDVAKGRGGDHSTLGAEEAEVFCRLHDLSKYDTRFACWLVQNHLIMSWTAQRQDISDPEVVLEFARKVGDQEHLDNLYLLTVADMCGTNPKVWNAWKERLLSQLYSATARVLRRGFATPLDIEAHVGDLRAGALKIIGTKTLPHQAVNQYWEQFDSDYFLRYDAESIAWHATEIAMALPSRLPIVATRYHRELGGTEFLIYTPDRDDLFVILTAGFELLNLSIVDARIHTTRTGCALDTFVVLDNRGQPISDARTLSQMQKTMREQLLHPRPGRDLDSAHLPRQLRHFPIETRVLFSLSPNKQLTVMEVSAQDRPGLLHRVALALRHCKINLVAAKVSTYGERAEDIFFINTRDATPITGTAQLKQLEDDVYRRLAPESGAAAVGISI